MLRSPGQVGQRVLDELAQDRMRTPDQTERLHPEVRKLRTVLALQAPSGGGVFVGISVVLLLLCITPLQAVLADSGPAEARTFLYVYVGGSIAMFVGLLIYALARRRRMLAQRAARLAEVTAWPTRQPFPVTGFASWLVADRPLLDLHMSGPVDQAKLARALHHIDAAITLEPIDDRTMRVSIPARVEHRRRTAYGNVPLLERVFRDLLLPLHGDGAIEHVTMGGLVS